MRTKPRNKKVAQLCTDRVAKLVYNSLRQDLHACTQCIEHRSPVLDDIKDFRRYVWPDLFGTIHSPDVKAKEMIVSRFKADYQLRSLFKKYRFQNDSLTTKQLREVTYQKYVDFQASRSCYNHIARRYNVVMDRSFIVVQRARKIIKKILGNFSWDEVFENCRFGGNSSVGCTFADAYLDHKFSAPEAFTGTVESITKFAEYLTKDSVLSEIFSGKVPVTHKILPLVQVPKKFDVNRTITPLTLLGLWLSYGLGRVIEGRLARRGLNIRTLQGEHQKLVEENSITLNLATLDMSFGSENIISCHLNAALPRAWFNALKMTFSRSLSHDGQVLYTESIMPMGNGATFPVETLFFYGLIRATGYLLKVPGRYSVYGDDIILPAKVVKYVMDIFGDLGLRLNKDKSFVIPHFRESCGADYYYGVSVRPFYMPEGMKYSHVTSSRYIFWLHKCINGLSRRWSPELVPRTLQLLLTELAVACQGKIYTIPPSFPDTAGVKITKAHEPLTSGTFDWQLPTVDYNHGSRNYNFAYYLELPRKRLVLNCIAYYWDTLRAKHSPFKDDDESVDLTSISYVDHLRYLRQPGKSTLDARSTTKWIEFKRKDGSTGKKKKVKWVYTCADRNKTRISVRARLETPEMGDPREADPIISDWI